MHDLNLPADSPWTRVFACIGDEEDALALCQLFEYRDEELIADGVPLDDVLGCYPSERPVAHAVAEWLNHLGNLPAAAPEWTYANFYASTRGYDHPAPEAFTAKCAAVGVTLSYRPPTPRPL